MKVPRFICWLLVVVALILTKPAHGANYYVRPDGNNANDGLADDAAHAWSNIDWGQPTVLAEEVKNGETIKAATRKI